MIQSQPGGLQWPKKHDVFGVLVSATSYQEAVDVTIDAARQHAPSVVSLHAVHALISSSTDADLREQVNRFQIVAPDGQPVRWALNILHKTGLRERVYGPELMLRLCQRAAEEGVSIYLYGGSEAVIDALSERLPERFPGVVIAGAESPPFRELSAKEIDETIDRINASGAGIVFIGLGCPKQDFFAAAHRDRIHAVQVCVGAAFDFHAGHKAMAPRWMQSVGLEWLFRLGSEPRRLWKRYLVTNSIYVGKLVAALCRGSRNNDRKAALAR